MEYLGLIVIASIVGLIFLAFAVRGSNQRKRRERLFAEAHEFAENVKARKALTPVSTQLMLKVGEKAFYSGPSELLETRAVRHYQSGGSRVRIAKGVYVGGSKGRSVSTQEWSLIDNGVLTVTNKRIIFDGGAADRTVVLNKVLNVDSSLSGVEVTVEGRQKSMIFGVRNPLIVALIIRICAGVGNPEDLSGDSITITFED